MDSTSSSGNGLSRDAKAGNALEQMNENGDPGMSAADKIPSRKRTKGSRIAANLTADQLARKRASDRNAQQAARQRTRDYIEHLEARVEEINRQQVRLQDAKMRTGQLEAELEGLKEKLGKLEGKSVTHLTARVLGELVGRTTYRTFADKLASLNIIYPPYE